MVQVICWKRLREQQRTALPGSRLLATLLSNPDRAAAKRALDAIIQMGKIDIVAIEAARRG